MKQSHGGRGLALRDNQRRLRRAFALAEARLPALLSAVGAAHVDPARVGFGTIETSTTNVWWATWANDPNHAFDWRAERAYYERYTRRFELAIFYDRILHGLCLGRLAANKRHLSLNLLEGNPDKRHPLKGYVALLAVHVALRYCEQFDARELWLVNPIDEPKVRALYEGMGFTLERRPDGVPYFRMEI